MKRRLIISLIVLPLLYFGACHSGTSPGPDDISRDPAVIAGGEAVFTQHCSSCHNFKRAGIGPQLGGLTAEVPADWIRRFITDPKKMIESGDKRAQRLFKRYKAVMPSFAHLAGDEINGILAFLNTHKKPDLHSIKEEGGGMPAAVPDAIKRSDLVVGLELMTQIPPSSDSGKLPLTRITKLDFQPATGDLFIVDIRGKLYRLENNVPAVYLDISKLKPRFTHKAGLGTGFGSFAFHPDFARNGLLYTAHAEAPGSGRADFAYDDSIKVTLQWVVSEWKTDQPDALTFSGTSRELFRADMVSVSHGVQEIAFNPFAKPGGKDYGLLYIAIGDGGSVEEGYPFLAHSKDKIWGTILRIDPRGSNSANGRYGIPKDNPFANIKNANTLGEIYAFGFRNPHRITWNKSGQMLVSNIGGENIESLNLILPGHDYGWPIREGNFVLDLSGNSNKVYPLPANDSVYGITYPVAQYGHGRGFTAISGGYEYLGGKIPELAGKFIFGDIPSGRLFYVNTADFALGKLAPISEFRVSINGALKTFKELSGTDQRVDLHFGRDASGELYILIKPDGKVYKLVSATLQSSGEH